MPRVLVREEVSAYALLQRSGYFDRHAEITPALLQAVLSDDPTLVRDWLDYSENKRTGSGWYFRRASPGFEVGSLAREGKVDDRTYADSIEACAVFIKREIEEMRQLG
jgi:hypothetical protein